MANVTVRDESATGRELSSLELFDLPDEITVRELVRLRVREEVARFNLAAHPVFSGLVQPTETEAVANGYRLKSFRRLDWERQADVAEAAFARNGYFIIINDRQVASLDDLVDLRRRTEVAFIKLVALVGG